MKNKIKVLELFAGSRSWGKIADDLGCEVFSVDWKDFEGIDLVIDIENLEENMLPWIPDVVIDGRPCTTFSMAAGKTHRLQPNFEPKTPFAAKCDRMNVKLNTFYKKWNCIYYIENPRAMLRKMPYMKDMDKATVWYCKYGDIRAKPTDIFSNNIYSLLNPNGWIPRPMCKNFKYSKETGEVINKHCHHESARRGSKTGTQGLKNNYERSKVPEELCLDILKATINKLSKENEK